MSQEKKELSAGGSSAEPVPSVAPSPHFAGGGLTTRRMMLDVLMALAPVLAAAVWVFQWHAVIQVGFCVLGCMAAEALFEFMRGRRAALEDGSAILTGVILGLSLPWSAPWYISIIASFAAIGLGKAVFGGLGCNIFNPAMVGRAFVMLSFAKALGASAYVSPRAGMAAVTQATPLTVLKQAGGELAAGGFPSLWPLLTGNVNGSLGETSALALILGGIYLCVRRAASWEIPAGVLLAAFLLGGLANLFGLSAATALQHLISGALLFGAFFIATDPVTSPLTPKGKFIFGLGVGALVILLRIFSSYPEGVMFAVLLMNAAVPLINLWTIPEPLGGPAPVK